VAEHVPWFVRAGVRQFHVGPQVRPGASYKAFVDAGHVRSWRLLLDDVCDQQARHEHDRPARTAG
jgi:copper homeostasis protein